MLLMTQQIVGREHVGGPSADWVGLIGLFPVQVVGIDPTPGSMKGVRASRLHAVLVVSPGDAGRVVQCCDNRRAGRPRDSDWRKRRPQLVASAWPAIREHPRVQPLEFETSADNVRGQPGEDTVVCHNHQPGAGLDHP